MAKQKQSIKADEVGSVEELFTESQTQEKDFEDRDLKVARTSVQLVTKFHKTFGHPVGTEPKIIDRARQDLRFKLIKEETEESRLAAVSGDLIELADGLGDLQFVLDGAFVEFGLADKKEAIMAEIYRSNMSKSCATEQDAIETVRKLQLTEGECYHKEVLGRWVVYRTSDNKIMKSLKYSPVDLKSILFPEKE